MLFYIFDETEDELGASLGIKQLIMVIVTILFCFLKYKLFIFSVFLTNETNNFRFKNKKTCLSYH